MILKANEDETNLKSNVDQSNSACFLCVYNLLLLLYKKHLLNNLIFNTFDRVTRLSF